MEEYPTIKQEILDQIDDTGDNNCDIEFDVPEYINITTQTPFEETKNITEKKTTSTTTKKSSQKKQSVKVKKDPGDEKPKKSRRSKYIPKPKTCDICGQQLSCAKSLNLHMRIHNDEKPFKCDICDKLFRQRGGLSSHMLTHSKQKPFPCPNCDGSFTTSSSLKRHLKRIHESGKRFDCKSCPESFYSMVSFIAHKKEKHSGIWGPRKCTECGIMLYNSRMSSKHFRVKHFRKPMRKPTNNKCCILCGKEFETIKLYIEHKYQHLQYTKEELRTYGIENVYPCKICDSKFSSLGIIVGHIATHMEQTYECQPCNEKFSYYLYKKHMKQVHDEITCYICSEVFIGGRAIRAHRAEKHYAITTCRICDSIFPSKHGLGIHMKTEHKTEIEVKKRKNECLYCHQVFVRKEMLNRHVLRDHNNMLKRSCDICNIKFEYYYEFSRHVQSQHARLFKRKKLHLCYLCNRVYKDPAALRSHLCHHYRQLPYKCEICYNELVNKDNYSEKLLSKKCQHRTVDVKVTCKECSKDFMYNGNLKRHLLIHSIKDRTCRFCLTDFEDKDNFKQHFLENHPHEKLYHCEYCNMELLSFNEMMKHRKSQSHKKKFRSFTRYNRHLFIKMVVVKNTDSSEEINSMLIKQETEVVSVKIEPPEEDMEVCDSSKHCEIKTEPIIS